MVTGRGILRPWDPIFWRETNYGALNAVTGNTPPGILPITGAGAATQANQVAAGLGANWEPVVGWKVQNGGNLTSFGITSLTGRELQAGDIGIGFFLGLSTAPGVVLDGWTQLASDNASGDATTYRVHVYAKVLTGSETSFGVTGPVTGDNTLMVAVFDGSIWGGWEDPIADATLSGSSTYTPAALTASGAGSVFIEAMFMRGNVSKTSSGFTGPAWHALHLEGTGSGTPPMLGLLVNNQSPGGAPSLQWFVNGVTRDFQSAGIVVTS